MDEDKRLSRVERRRNHMKTEEKKDDSGYTRLPAKRSGSSFSNPLASKTVNNTDSDAGLGESKAEFPTGVEAGKPAKRKRKRRVLPLLLIVLLVLGIVATNPFTFVIMGSDARVGESVSGSRTDSLQVVQFLPRSRAIQNVSIPRDTYTAIPCEPEREGDKITHAFAYGGATCTIGAVEGLLDQKMDGHVVITFASFIELVDLIDGVNITATHSFTEKGLNATYEYVEGVSYAMDGDMALAYARHRKSDTDGARSSRQTEVMAAVAKKLLSPSGVVHIPAAYRYVTDEMGLDMNPFELLSVGLTMIMKPDMNKMQVEGEDAYINQIYYYVPDEQALEVIREAIDPTLFGTVR